MSTRFRNIAIVTLLLVVVSSVVWAVPPSPEAKARWIEEGTWEQNRAIWQAIEASMTPEMLAESAALHRSRHSDRMALSEEAVDTVRVCVILVEFPDFQHDDSQYTAPGGRSVNCYLSATREMFDSLLFTEQGKDTVFNPTGSMTEYYLEVSYGNYYVIGDVYGWYTAPNNYYYYVGNDAGGSRSPELARQAVQAADAAGVNFAPYANGTSMVPGVMIIHAGPGAEQGAYGIWSHRSNMSPGITLDGVYLGGYDIQPEETYGSAQTSGVGVFCHEYGHVLGLPDYYDVADNPGSEGLGEWCLMASGSWNLSGRRPSHMNPQAKYELGWNTPDRLTANRKNVAIPPVATSPVCFLLQDNPGGANPNQWWVENRQQIGFDASLPGSGLIIYHMDASGSQMNPDRYWMSVEEADNNHSLNYGGDRGQAGDAWPGPTGNRDFHDYSSPSSRTYEGAFTEVSVLNISNSDSIMYADLGVTYALPWLFLAGDSLTVSDILPGGDGDGVFEPGETVSVWLEVQNVMMKSFNPILHLEVDNPALQVQQNDQYMGLSLNPITTNENFSPILIEIPDDFSALGVADFPASIVTLDFTITSDSTTTSGDHSFSSSFSFDIQIGRTQILLVDDDNGMGDVPRYVAALNRLRLPFATWDKAAEGSPDFAMLSQYKYVLWTTGSYYPEAPSPILGGQLSLDDVAFMQDVLDAGGCLLMGSPTAAVQLQTLDPTFLANYLHAGVTGTGSREYFRGLADNPVGGGLLYTAFNGVIWNLQSPILSTVNGGVNAFSLTRSSGVGNFGTCGVSYDGAYRTLLLSFGVEYLAHDRTADGYAPVDSLIARALRFFVRGSAMPVEDDPDGLLPTRFALDQNYPNPFNPITTIDYHIDAGALQRTRLEVINVLGQKVATLVDKVQPAGDYTVTWQGTDDAGNKVASGVYFYRLSHGEEVVARKMMLLK